MSAEQKPTNRNSYLHEDRLSTLKRMVERKLEAVKADKASREPSSQPKSRNG